MKTTKIQHHHSDPQKKKNLCPLVACCFASLVAKKNLPTSYVLPFLAKMKYISGFIINQIILSFFFANFLKNNQPSMSKIRKIQI